MKQQDLFEEFQKTSASEWMQKIMREQKGADFEESLHWESPEGIKVKPFYHSDDLDIPAKSSVSNGIWKICQRITVTAAEEANEMALDAISRGAESILFKLSSNNIPLENLLKGFAKGIPVYFDFEFLSPSFFEKERIRNKSVFWNLDCIGNLARTGNWFSGEEEDFETLKSFQDSGESNIISIDVSLYQNAGANIVQQLAYGLAHLNEYLARGIINSNVTFKVSVGSNYFFEIAKIRAFKWLFEILAQEYDLIIDCHIIAEPSKRNKTIYDYNVNMLRTTTESMAAVLGGADTVCNLSYDSVFNKPNEFGVRISRNQLLILKNESYFSKVYNPVDGAYYIEALTKEVAKKALQKFKEIESNGGFLELLKKGSIQDEITESARIDQEKFDNEELIFIGSNAFQDFDTKMKDNLELKPFQEKKLNQTIIEPILEKRLSSALEQKRMDDE